MTPQERSDLGEMPKKSPVYEAADSIAEPEMDMTQAEHLSELRRRLLIAVLTVLFFTIVGFIFIDPITYSLRQPAPKDFPLHQFSTTESLFALMKVALRVGVAAAMPMLVYQTGAYILPGLARLKRRYLSMLLLTSTIAFLVGMAFCYFVLLPFSLGFLVGAQSDNVISVISMSTYFSIVTRMLLAYGLIFQTPTLVCCFLAIGLVGTRPSTRLRPFTIMIVATIAIVITFTIYAGLADQVRILP